MSELAYSMGPVRSAAAKWGLGVAAVTAAYDVYGVFGDDTAPASQRDALPFMIAMGLVVVAIVFGLLVPAGLRAIDQRAASASRWALGHAIAAMVSIVVFWSGLPLILGTAAVVLGVAGGRSEPTGKKMSISRGMGVFAAAAALIITIGTNLLHI